MREQVGEGEDATRVRRLGQYLTAVWGAEQIVQRYFGDLDATDHVVEPACGHGAFLSAIPPEVPATGIDIDARMASLAAAQTGREILVGDFRTVPLRVRPTAIIGNPPFQLRLIDAFLDRAHQLLPGGGRVGFILPAYAFQTASRVAGYADRWSLFQEMIPRNLFPGLSLPLVFAIFSKDRRRTVVGFALFREVVDVQSLPDRYRELMSASAGPIWRRVVEAALSALGGEADLEAIYAEVEGCRPTRTRFWREQIRRTVQRYTEAFQRTGRGRYRLAAWAPMAEAA